MVMESPPTRVLLLEDDEDDKFLTSEALHDVRRTRYEITWVTTVERAIAEIRTGEHDVALLDYRVGANTGLDVLSAVKDCPVPCILLTGQRDHETDVAAMEAGAADYMVKDDLSSDAIERSIRYAVERANSLRELRESELRFRVVVESATDGIILTDDRGKLLTWNESALRLFGLTTAHAPETGLLELVSSGQGDRDLLELLDAAQGDLTGRRADGSSFPVSLSLSNWEGVHGRLWSAIIRDVTTQKSMEDRLVRQAFHDPLTGLANRALFANRVAHAIVRLQRRPGAVGVLFLDLDDFKRIYDSMGHAAGDDLLTAVSERLANCVRNNDTVARLGGDEFAVLVEDAEDPKTAMVVAGRIMRAMQPSFHLQNQEVEVSCSVGVAVTINDTTRGPDLLRDADVAMYAAKARGKNCVEVFEDRMHTAIMDRVSLESDLRRAVERGEIVAHYQPILNLHSGDIVGFEALARWEHPERGLLGPASFIDVAEANGMIVAIGKVILDSACAQLREWRSQFGSQNLTVSVNLSNRQIEDDAIVDTIQDAIVGSGIPPDALVLEITESLMLNRAGPSADRLKKIAETGVRIAIDDFGTGYSSLSYLQDLPLSVLKVDRAFISRIDEAKGRALVEAILAMSKSLGLSTIAEGVESSDQLAALNTFGCSYGQGYLFAKPLAAPEVERILNRQARLATEGIDAEHAREADPDRLLQSK